MRAEPEHRAILALDIEGFGRLERSNLVRARMRAGLHRIIGTALSAAGIEPEYIEQTEYGDGVLVLLGPQVSKARLLHPLLPRLVSGLARYNRTAADAARLRVRVVVHAGELLRDAHGITGEDLVLAFRLLDADVVRAQLTQAVADLVLVVSEAIYQGIVKHGYGRIDPAVFQAVWVTAKETSTRAWLHIPGPGRHDRLASPAAATGHSLTAPLRSGSSALPAPVPAAQPTSPVASTPLAGRGLSGTWQIPAYAFVQGCQVDGSWMPLTTSIGYPVEESTAPNFWTTVLYPADRDRVIAADAWSEQTLEPFQMTYRHIAPDGRCVWVRDNCVAMYDDTGTPRYWLGAVLELTDRAIMELDATRRLKVLNALSTTFLTVAARKLRAPLTSLLATCRTLQQARDRLPEHAKTELLSGVVATVRRLDRLLTDVIDLQRLDWGAVTLDRQPVDIATLVQRAAARWRAHARWWPEVLATSVTVRLDASKVERILQELLANAITHAPPGTPVWVRTAPHGTGVLITVEDAGPGIPREFRTAVFERFSRDRTTLVHPPGVGIGLSLVLRLAELHGGTAWLQDRPGGGTSVSVILPGPPPAASFADLEPAVLY